jgi:hypothetical protein
VIVFAHRYFCLRHPLNNRAHVYKVSIMEKSLLLAEARASKVELQLVDWMSRS